MKRLFASLLIATTIFAMTASTATARDGKTADRPNILWITSEDNSPILGCYGDKNAVTPNLDKFATESILYTNAFANAPVCAPTRSTIIHGLYANSMGTQHMRSRYDVPETIKLFPQYLREAGYFCSNHSKTDYNRGNADTKAAWNSKAKNRYNSREERQPFFCVINIGTSHESSLHRVSFDQELAEKRRIPLPPYHPDLPEIRCNWEQYYNVITKMDQQVGDILETLERDGLADNTIVFYYGDHGGILTRSKRFLFDSGVRVPMIVRFPKKYQHLAPSVAGSVSDRCVSFVDLAPTVLSLAGIDIPDYMQGDAFLGPKKTADPEYAYLFRGRMDERYDMQRAVRDGQFKYIRQYMPHRKWGQHLEYLWKMATTQAWEKAYKEGKCNAAKSRFWGPKPVEELYDITRDPWEVDNLAGDPAYAVVLKKMREANRAHLLEVRDSGFLPESEMIARAKGSTIYEMVRDPQQYPLERIMPIAEMASEGDAKNLPRLIELMKDEDPAIRYWAATGCVILGGKATSAERALTALLKDSTPSVRIAAAEALCKLGKTEPALKVLIEELENPAEKVALHAVNVLEEIGPTAKGAIDALRRATKSSDGYVVRAAKYALSKFETGQ